MENIRTQFGKPLSQVIRLAFEAYRGEDKPKLLLAELATYTTPIGERSFYSLFSSVSQELLKVYLEEVDNNISGKAEDEDRAPLVRDDSFRDKAVYIEPGSFALSESEAEIYFLDPLTGSAEISPFSEPETHFRAFAHALFAKLNRAHADSGVPRRHGALLAIPFARMDESADDLSEAKAGGVLFVLAEAPEGTNWEGVANLIFHELVKMICMEASTANLGEQPGTLAEIIAKELWSDKTMTWFGLDVPTHRLSENLENGKPVWNLLKTINRYSKGDLFAMPATWGSDKDGLVETRVYEALKHLTGCDAACQNVPYGGGQRHPPSLDCLAVLAICILDASKADITDALKGTGSLLSIEYHSKVPSENLRQAVKALIKIFAILSKPHGKSNEEENRPPPVKKIFQIKDRLIIHLAKFKADGLPKRLGTGRSREIFGRRFGEGDPLLPTQCLCRRTCLHPEFVEGIEFSHLKDVTVMRGRQVTCSFDIYKLNEEECYMCITCH